MKYNPFYFLKNIMDTQDLRIYAFENALNILSNSVEVFNSNKIDELFILSDKIYKYLNIEEDAKG